MKVGVQLEAIAKRHMGRLIASGVVTETCCVGMHRLALAYYFIATLKHHEVFLKKSVHVFLH